MKSPNRLKLSHLLLIGVIGLLLLNSNGHVLFAAGPSLESLHPPVGSRGSEFVVVAKGASLGSTAEVLIHSPGIECVGLQARSDEEVELRLRALPDCELGSYPIRLRTPNGMSELRTVTISPFPVCTEEVKGWNSSLGATSIVGTLAGIEVDRYEVTVKKGDLLSCEVYAVRLGIGLLDTKLIIRNQEGTILHQVDDSPMTKQDPNFSFQVKQDCNLTVEITSVGSADADSYYVMHLGPFPRPAGIFPLGATPNRNLRVSLIRDSIAENNWLEVCKLDSLEVPAANSSITSNSIELLADGVACPSKIPFRTSHPSQQEVWLPPKTDVQSVEQTMIHQYPFAANGTIESEGEEDQVSFLSSIDGLCSVEVFANRMGSLLDAVVELRTEDGHVIARGDDLDGHDPRIEFFATAKTKYEVCITDKRRKGGNLFSYRVEVGSPTHHESVSLARRNKLSQARQVMDVPRGNRVLCLLGVKKEDTSLAAHIRVSNLPSGLHCSSIGELPGTSFAPVVFEASPMATLQGGTLSIGASLVDGESVVREIPFLHHVDLVNGPADALFIETQLHQLAYAITNEVPYQVELIAPTLELPIDGTLGIRVKVTRSSNFKSPIDVSIPMLPEWVDAPEKIQIPAGQDEGVITLRSLPESQPMQWSLIAEASVGIAKKQANAQPIDPAGDLPRTSNSLDYPVLSSSIHSLTIGKSPCIGTLTDAAAEQGGEVSMECSIDFQSSNDEKFVATLEGLPNRIEAPSVNLKPGDTSIEFRLKLAEDAPLGTFKGLVCRIHGERNEESISFCVGRGASLVVSPKGMIQKDSRGRPLSPLEVLRSRNSSTQPTNE
jgi:hypothetical protein